MRRKRVLFTAFLSGLGLLLAGAAPAREVESLDERWQFIQDDPNGAEQPGYDDQQWRQVNLPHDWAIAGSFDKAAPARGEGGFLPTGVAWYRKRIPTPQDLGDRRVVVQFDGVMANSKVWINGHLLGERPNGYVSFAYDLTDHLNSKPGEDNLLAVRTDTSQQVASRWYTGSGIYRHVRLLLLDPVHVALDGVHVTTPIAEEKMARVACSIDIKSQRDATQQAALRMTLSDPGGRELAVEHASFNVEPGETTTQSLEFKAPNPVRWGPDNPELYSVRSEVLVDDRVVDSVTTNFGIRNARFDADTGFWINGQNIKLKGVCVHHCAGAVGAAVPLDLWRYRLETLRGFGVNAIRTAHNPVAPEFLDLCDQMGMLVMDEFFDCWLVGKRKHDYHKHFEEWAHQDLRDTIRRDRNHPCVILYSVGNEIHDTPHEQQAKRILSGLVEVCHATDETIPVTQALFRPNVSHDYDNGLADMLDVIGTNYRDLELLQAWRDDPTRKIVGTEQSHDRSIWLACRDHPQHAGQFLWCGIDYLGESRRWPVTTFNAGLIDRTGHPRPRAYERQSWWTERPMVRAFRRVAPTEQTPSDPGYEAVEWKRRQVLFSDWTPESLAPHEEKVEVYSNCQEVELLLNGQSLGVQAKPRNARPRIWEVTYQPGELVAQASNDGRVVARHTLRTAQQASQVQLTANRETLPVGWDHVAVVQALLTDGEGTRVPRAARNVTFRVEGPGEIVAVDNGSIVSHEPFQANQRTTHQGRCIAIIRATGDNGGTIRVTADSPDLAGGAVEIAVGR